MILPSGISSFFSDFSSSMIELREVLSLALTISVGNRDDKADKAVMILLVPANNMQLKIKNNMIDNFLKACNDKPTLPDSEHLPIDKMIKIL